MPKDAEGDVVSGGKADQINSDQVSGVGFQVSAKTGNKTMKKKWSRLALIAMLFALCASAQAQQAKKVPMIGYLGGSSLSVAVGEQE